MTGSPRLRRLGSLKVRILLADHVGEGTAVRAGSIFIARRNAKRPNVYRNIFEAHRSRIEILLRYGVRRDGQLKGGEIDALAEARKSIQAARDTLGDSRLRSAEATRYASETMTDLTFWLKRGIDPTKATARERAEAGVAHRPSGRPDRDATEDRLAEIDDQLAKREEDVSGIVPWMTAMETALRLELWRSLRIVEDVDRRVSAVLSAHPLFGGGKCPKSEWWSVSAALARLGREAGKLLAAPFRAFGQDAARRLANASSAASLGDALGAQAQLKEVRDGARRLLCRRRLESLILDATVAAMVGGPPSVRSNLRGRAVDLGKRITSKPGAAALRLTDAQAGDWRDELVFIALLLGDGSFDEAKEKLKAIADRVS